MKISYSIALIFLTASVIGIASCKKEKCETDVPVIKFESFIQFADSSGKLTVSFEDCDGDIGLKDSETDPPYDLEGGNYHNLFLDYLEMQNGTWVKFTTCDSFTQTDPPCLLIPYYYRIPYIEPEGNKKKLEGEISVDLEPFYFLLGNEHSDTIKFEIMLKDRALNESNTVSTPMIIVPK